MADPRALLDAYAKKETILLAVGDPTCEGRWTPFGDIAPATFAALRAVLDLHPIGNPGVAAVAWCGGCGDVDTAPDWPCPTVRAITIALEADRG